MKKIHITLQGKGGVGKSLVSSLIAQCYLEHKKPVMCIDTDPINTTLLGYKSLNVKHIQLMDNTRLNERRFDEMMEILLSDKDSHYVIDNGASAFIALSNYLIENQAIDLLHDTGKEIMVHTVITGGQGLMDTLNGFAALATQLPETAQLVVWLNEFFGPIEADGKSFEEMKTYLTHRDRIKGIIRIRQHTGDTFGKDMAFMLDKRMTFDDANSSPDYNLMAKQRLTMVKRAIFDQMHWMM